MNESALHFPLHFLLIPSPGPKNNKTITTCTDAHQLSTVAAELAADLQVFDSKSLYQPLVPELHGFSADVNQTTWT
jgi:hypothetical protein